MSCDYSTVPLVRCMLLVRSHSTTQYVRRTRLYPYATHAAWYSMYDVVYRMLYVYLGVVLEPWSGAWSLAWRGVAIGTVCMCQSSCAVVRHFAICLC